MIDARPAEPYPTATAPAPGEGALNLRRYIAVFRRRLLPFGLTALLVFLAVTVFALNLTQHYVATAQVVIDTRKQNVVDVEQVLPGLTADTSTIDTQVEVLRSRALIERVADELHLDRVKEYSPEPPKGAMLTAEGRRQRMVDAVATNLKITRAGLTDVIGVSFRSRSAALASQVANAFVQDYTKGQIAAKVAANADATRFLSGRVDELRGQVEAAEAAVQHYKAANGLLSAQGNTLTETDISNLSQQVATARASEAEQVARLNTARAQLRSGSNGGDVGEALNSPVVQQLRAQRATVSRQVADLEQRYGPKYPDLIRAQTQLADIDQQIQAEIRRVISNLDAQAQVARQRTASIQGSLSATQGTLAANDNASVAENELERRADSLRTLYQAFLDRLQQTTAQQGLQDADARVLSAAQVPSKAATPNIPLLLLAGLALGLAAGAALVLVEELLDDRLATTEDVERQLDVPALPGVPDLDSTLKRGRAFKGAPMDYVLTTPLSAFAEAFRNLRASVFTSGRGGAPVKVVVITSSLPDEGKTTTAACLARTLAMAGQSVVLVDCDLRRRNLSALMSDRASAAGLVEVLDGEATLDAALVQDGKSGMAMLPVSKAAATAKDMFGTPAMDALLETLRSRFDVVVLDTAPALSVADTRVLAQKADAVIMVARWRKTPRNAVRAGLGALETVGANVAGVALSRIDMRQQQSSGYGDPGYFSKASRAYYVQ